MQTHLARKQRPLPERTGILAVSERAYLRLFQLVLNKRHRLQEIGRANRLCTLVAVQDSAEVVELDRTFGWHSLNKTEAAC